jgi:hypothetical protein
MADIPIARQNVRDALDLVSSLERRLDGIVEDLAAITSDLQEAADGLQMAEETLDELNQEDED